MSKKTIEKSKENFCGFCNKIILGNSYKFKAHLYGHNVLKPRYECKVCMKGYYRYDTYTTHLKGHGILQSLNKNVFICDYCDRHYGDKRNLIMHLRIHDDSIAPNILRFKCRACGASYCENRILINHIRRVHFNPVPNNEPGHVKRMVNESWLEPVSQTGVYVQITKVKNNVISIKKCGKIKNEKTSLKDKRQPKKKKLNNQEDSTFLRTDNYTGYSKAICDYCNKEMLKKSIHNHMREAHFNVKKFQCEICNRAFNRRYQLTGHICGTTRRKYKSKLNRSSNTEK